MSGWEWVLALVAFLEIVNGNIGWAFFFLLLLWVVHKAQDREAQ